MIAANEVDFEMDGRYPQQWVYAQRLARSITDHTGIEVLNCMLQEGEWWARTQFGLDRCSDILSRYSKTRSPHKEEDFIKPSEFLKG